MSGYLYKKVTPEMSRKEKEEILYAELLRTDRQFTQNCREMDLFSDYGRETARHFIRMIEMEETRVGRRLNASEIEDEYQRVREEINQRKCISKKITGLEKWKQ